MKGKKGFTLVELMFVIAVIGILASIAIPDYLAYRDRAYLAEGYELAGPLKKDIIDYYGHVGEFPENKAALGYSAPVKGKYVRDIRVKNGVMEIIYNRKAGRNKNGIVKLIPVINTACPTGPVRWKMEKHLDKSG